MTRELGREIRSANDSAALLAMLGIELPARARAFIPAGAVVNWVAVVADPRHPIVFVSSPLQATHLCSQGQAAIAVMGISKGKLANWLRERGAVVRDKSGAH